MILDPETVMRCFSGKHDVALIEIVVIRYYFNNNFILMIMILMNKVVQHNFVCLCSYTSIGNIWILILFVYRFISETYSEYYYFPDVCQMRTKTF